MNIKLPLVSVSLKGIIEYASIRLEDPQGDPRIVISRGIDEGGVADQLHLARQIAHFFLTRPYVQPLASHTLERGTLVVEFEAAEQYEGGSFGLAFLAGCLALGLQTRLREGLLFSAAIREPLESHGMPGGGCQLDPVKKLPEKLAAACTEHKVALYLHTDDERALLEFEREFWRGEAERSCLPFPLPPSLSTAAVAALALDTEHLLEQAVKKTNGAAFALLMLYASGELNNGASFAKGIGPAMARLRVSGHLDSDPTVETFSGDLGYKNITSGDDLVPVLFDRCVKTCSADQMLEELVTAAIATNPSLPLFDLPSASLEVTEGPASDNLDLWLRREPANGPARLQFVVQVFDICSRIAPDMAPYWLQARKLVMKSLAQHLEFALHLTQKEEPVRAAQLLEALGRINLGEYFGKLRPEWIPEARDLIKKTLRLLGDNLQNPAVQMARGLHQHLTNHYLPEVLRPALCQDEEPLVLTFRIAAASNKPPQGNVPRPEILRINDLELHITGPNELSLLIPSPVLLLEGAHSGQRSAFCKRRGMTLSDDTLSRYPNNDAMVARDLFGNSFHPTMICFSNKANEKPFSIRWTSSLTPWPPAIDSQLFVASLVQHGQCTSPQSLLDVGCGTGYLNIAAAHVWPSLTRVDYLDLNPMAVAVTQANIASDPMANQIPSHGHALPFSRFQASGYDILLCTPPYLPDRPLPVSAIELATHGTALLEEVIERATPWHMRSGYLSLLSPGLSSNGPCPGSPMPIRPLRFCGATLHPSAFRGSSPFLRVIRTVMTKWCMSRSVDTTRTRWFRED